MVRAGLVNRLRAARRVPVVAVTAPAGYGKTTLVQQWASRDDRVFAVCELAPDDDAAAVVRKLGAAAAALGESDAAADGCATDEALALLARRFASGGEVVIVVDGADRLGDARAIRTLRTFAGGLVAGCQLVLVGDGEPPLELPRLRARGHLVELGVEDLRFTDREAAALLHAAGVDPPPREVRALNRHLAGRAHGLRLVAQSPPGTGDAVLVEPLAPLAEVDRRFLSRSAVLDPLTGPLCAAVTGAADAQSVLERLDRSGLGVLPLDRERRRYDIPPVIREELIAELEQREPGAAAALRTRASDWCRDRGDLEAAIGYAHAAGDRERVAGLLGSSVLPFSSTTPPRTVERWLAGIDDEGLLERHPEAAAVGAVVHALAGRPEAALRWGGSASRHGAPEDAWSPLMRVILATGDPAGPADAADETLARLDAGSPWRVPALLALGETARLAGELDAADETFASAGEEAETRGLHRLAALALALRSLLAAEAGDHGRADALATAAASAVLRDASAPAATVACVHAAGARAALHRGDWERVRSCVDAAEAVSSQLTYALGWISLEILLELAAVQLALGEAARARVSLEGAEDVLARAPQHADLVQRLGQLRARLDSLEATTNGSGLTAAELRLLPLLTTHLSFREIAEQLFVSRNTVKTQAISVYRKLGVSARDEAIGQALARGLVGNAAREC